MMQEFALADVLNVLDSVLNVLRVGNSGGNFQNFTMNSIEQ